VLSVKFILILSTNPGSDKLIFSSSDPTSFQFIYSIGNRIVLVDMDFCSSINGMFTLPAGFICSKKHLDGKTTNWYVRDELNMPHLGVVVISDVDIISPIGGS
jgi:hypothetical protein